MSDAADDPRFEFGYDFTEADFQQLSRAYNQYYWGLKRPFFLLISVYALVFLGGFALSFRYDLGLKEAVIITVCGALIYFFGLRFLTPLFRPGLCYDGGIIVGRISAVVDRGGILITHEKYRCHYHWSAVMNVLDEAGAVVLQMDKLAGILIPERAFQTADVKAEFIEFARQAANLPAKLEADRAS